MRPRTWMTSCPEALRILEFEKKKTTVSWDLNSERQSWDSSLEARPVGVTKCVTRLLKRLCLSLLMSKNIKLKKVLKSFVPEPEIRQCFKCFRIPISLRTFVNVFRIRMNMSISRVRILVLSWIFWWTEMLHKIIWCRGPRHAVHGMISNLGARDQGNGQET